VKRARIRRFLDDLRRRDGLISSFDVHAWNTLAESITVYDAGDFMVRFKDGAEIRTEG
jgi:hypothetical protein